MTAIPDIAALLAAGTPRSEAYMRDQVWQPIVAAMAELPGAGARTELTIAAGVITPTAAVHTVDTEGDTAADDLTHIATDNHPVGRVLVMSAADQARVPTVRHGGGGAGQVLLSGTADWALSGGASGRVLVLVRVGTGWEEVGRWWGGDAAGLRTWLGTLPATRTITAGTGLTGGGDLTADRTLSLSSAAQASLALADTALQSGDIGSSVQAFDPDIPTASASQAEMEAGTETALRSMSPLGIAQAITAQVGGGGWEPLQTVTASNDAAVDFTTLSAAYSMYAVAINNLVPASNSYLAIRVSVDGGATWKASNGDYNWAFSNHLVAHTGQQSTTDVWIQVSDSAVNQRISATSARGGLNGLVFIASPGSTDKHKSLWGTYTYQSEFSTASAKPGSFGGHFLSVLNVEGIRFLMSHGNISSGTLTLYGLKGA